MEKWLLVVAVLAMLHTPSLSQIVVTWGSPSSSYTSSPSSNTSNTNNSTYDNNIGFFSEDIVALRWPGNSKSYDEGPITGRLTSLAFFRGARAVIALTRFDDLTGDQRFSTDGSDLTDITIPVFQIGYDAGVALSGFLVTSSNASLFNTYNNASIIGKLNPFEEVYLAPISYVAQAVVELLNFLVLIFGLYVFAGKAKNHKGHCKANVALWCLGMVICSCFAIAFYCIDVQIHSGIFSAWLHMAAMLWFTPFSGSSSFLLMTFWAAQMTHRGIGGKSNVTQKLIFFVAPLLFAITIALTITMILYREHLWAPELLVFFLASYFFFALTLIYFLCFIIYGSVVTQRYLAATSHIAGTATANRVLFTKQLLVAEAVFTSTIVVLFLFTFLTNSVELSYYGVVSIMILICVNNTLSILVLRGRLFKKVNSDNTSSRTAYSRNADSSNSKAMLAESNFTRATEVTDNVPTKDTVTSHSDETKSASNDEVEIGSLEKEQLSKDESKEDERESEESASGSSSSSSGSDNSDSGSS